MEAIKNKLIAELKHLEEKESKSKENLTERAALEICVLSVALCYAEKAQEIINRDYNKNKVI